jgi:hypothetical protein
MTKGEIIETSKAGSIHHAASDPFAAGCAAEHLTGRDSGGGGEGEVVVDDFFGFPTY